MVSKRSVEPARLRRCPASRQQWGCYRKGFFIQVDEYLLNDYHIFNASDHFDATAAGTARLNVDIENPLETLGLKLMAARRSAGVRSCASSGALG